jgi:heme o synthase
MTVATEAARTAPGLLRDLTSVFKLRIGMAIMLCARAGITVTPGPKPAAWRIVVLALAVLLSSASAGALNQYVERDLDARMKRTWQRPFAAGRFRPGLGWVAAIGLTLACRSWRRPGARTASPPCTSSSAPWSTA